MDIKFYADEEYQYFVGSKWISQGNTKGEYNELKRRSWVSDEI